MRASEKPGGLGPPRSGRGEVSAPWTAQEADLDGRTETVCWALQEMWPLGRPRGCSRSADAEDGRSSRKERRTEIAARPLWGQEMAHVRGGRAHRRGLGQARQLVDGQPWWAGRGPSVREALGSELSVCAAPAAEAEPVPDGGSV